MNYIIGTQQIGSQYQFGSTPLLTEMATRSKELGLNIVKFRYKEPDANYVMDTLGYKYHLMWFRSDSKCFVNGMGSTAKQIEYSETYEYTKNLLIKYNGTNKEFYLGNWEGDWYLIPQMNPSNPVDPIAAMGMIDWINIRQSAVTAARKDFPSTAKVWYYVEMNRILDAMDKGIPRLVNNVLPYVKVDYISLSSYDFQRTTPEYCQKVVDYISTKFVCTDSSVNNLVSRMIIGEFSRPYSEFVKTSNPDLNYTLANLEIFKKYVSLGFKFVLYWNFYNNEVDSSGNQVGYHLIDKNNKESRLYYSLKDYFTACEYYSLYSESKSESEFRRFAINQLDTIIKKLI